MVAIHTKFIGPTDTKPSRIKAYSTKDRPAIYISYHSSDRPFQDAAHAYCLKMGWTGQLIWGGTDDGEVFVFLPKGNGATVALHTPHVLEVTA